MLVYMPIISTIDTAQRRVITECQGVLTLQDFIYYHQSVWILPEVFGFDEIFDASHCDASQLNYSDLLNLVANAIQLSNVLPQSKSAVIITPDEQPLYDFYLTARQSFSNNAPQIGAFYNRKDALAWLS